MARPMKPLVRGGGYYPSNGWTPLVYAGGYTTANGGEEPAPPPIEKTVTGNPIHILDALAKPAQALSIALEPIQDLNGYDNPWPAGGGKNLYNADAIPNSSSGGITATVNNGVITLNGTATSNAYFTVGNTGLPVGTYKFSFNNAIANSDVRVSFRNSGGTYFADAGCDTVNKTLGISNGEPALVIIYIRSGAVLTNYVIKPQLEVGTAATDFAPYSNICPISGWDGVGIESRGKNLLKLSINEGTRGGITVTANADGSVTVNGTATESVSFLNYGQSVAPMKLKSGVTYTLSGMSGFTEFQMYLQLVYRGDETGNTISIVASNGPRSYTPTEDATLLGVYCSARPVTTVNNYTIRPMFEVGASASSYVPYVTGNTYTIQLGQTVYGGTLDVTSGKLTVDRAMVDLGTLTWRKTSLTAEITDAWVSQDLQGMAKAPTNSTPLNGIASSYAIGSANSLYSISPLLAVNNAGAAYVRDDGATNSPSGQLCYELATPIVYDLTPTEVSTLLGTNNVWSDSNGDLTLTYLADGNASEIEALNILLGNRYYNNHESDEPTDREALDIVLGGKK